VSGGWAAAGSSIYRAANPSGPDRLEKVQDFAIEAFRLVEKAA
jgi:hypothetical protein